MSKPVYRWTFWSRTVVVALGSAALLWAVRVSDSGGGLAMAQVQAPAASTRGSGGVASCEAASSTTSATIPAALTPTAALAVSVTGGAPAAPANPGASAPAAAPSNGNTPADASSGSGTGNATGPIVVSAASSLRDVLTVMATRYEESHPGAHVSLNFGASNMLSRQITEGAPVDAVFLADRRSMDAIGEAGRLSAGSVVDLLSNALAIVVPSDRPTTLRGAGDLAKPEFRKIALCDDSVPIGHYGRAWLVSRSALAAIEGRIVKPDDARATLAMVASGGADAGIVYRTDVRASKGVSVAYEVPPSETPGIVYPAAVLSDGPNPRGGKSFLDYASSPPAVWLFRDAGFVVLKGP